MKLQINCSAWSKTWALGAIAALAPTLSAGSQVISGTGPGGVIPDAATTPPVDGVGFDPTWNAVPSWPALISPVNVPHAIDKVTSISLIGLQHTYRGNLHVYLENPAGQRFNVIVRPGRHPEDPFLSFGDAMLVARQ